MRDRPQDRRGEGDQGRRPVPFEERVLQLQPPADRPGDLRRAVQSRQSDGPLPLGLPQRGPQEERAGGGGQQRRDDLLQVPPRGADGGRGQEGRRRLAQQHDPHQDADRGGVRPDVRRDDRRPPDLHELRRDRRRRVADLRVRRSDGDVDAGEDRRDRRPQGDRLRQGAHPGAGPHRGGPGRGHRRGRRRDRQQAPVRLVRPEPLLCRVAPLLLRDLAPRRSWGWVPRSGSASSAGSSPRGRRRGCRSRRAFGRWSSA